MEKPPAKPSPSPPGRNPVLLRVSIACVVAAAISGAFYCWHRTRQSPPSSSGPAFLPAANAQALKEASEALARGKAASPAERAQAEAALAARVVKVNMSNYALERPRHRQVFFTT